MSAAVSASGFAAAVARVRDEWLGRSWTVEDDVTPATMRRIAAMLDADPARFGRGAEVPAHWFSLFCAESAAQGALGADGHAAPGVVLPPIPLPRRMGAGRRVTLHGPFRVGEVLTKRAEVAAIEPKEARTGTICVLTLRHSFSVGDRPVAVDEFDAVYREAVAPGAASPVNAGAPAPADAAWREDRHLPESLVFRYSAITWNAHRIHYDADYARGAEGYPALVQNGGLTMQLLLDAAAARLGGRRLAGFTARLTRPVFVGDTVTLAGRVPDGDRMDAWVADRAGALCAQMELRLA